MPAYRHSPLEVRDTIRETLAGAGLSEVVTHALVAPRLAEAFRWESALPTVEGESPEGGRPILVTNPLSADHSVLRPALVGSLVQVVSTNLRHGVDDVAIFEIGKGYGAETDAVLEWWRLGLAATGAGDPASFNRPARPYDLDDAKGAIELLAAPPGLRRADLSPRAGRAAAPSGPGGAGRGAARRSTGAGGRRRRAPSRPSSRRGTCAVPASSSRSWT